MEESENTNVRSVRKEEQSDADQPVNNEETMQSMDQTFNDLVIECSCLIRGGGLTLGLRRNLAKYTVEKRKEIVSRLKDGRAPLFIACRRGHTEIVEYLITVCDADIEQRGIYEVFDDSTQVHYVTPLWCAAASGHLPVVKCLVSHGAEINAVSNSGSTPVRSACFVTHIDVIKYLLEHGADVNKVNHNGGTCLINSIQSVELCALLLSYGADVNASDIQDETALHYAIENHKLNCMKLLLEHNADPYLKSQYNNDALQTACLKGAIQIFEYLVENISYSSERLADAYELLGSTCIDDCNDTESGLKYWRAGLEIRIANAIDGVPLPKRPVLPKRDTYRNAVEFTTLEELDAIALDLDAIRIQSLLISERVLGPHHKDTSSRLMFRGELYTISYRYQDAINLWRRALEIRIEKDTVLYSDTTFTALTLLRLMLDLHARTLDHIRDTDQPRFCDIVAVFKLLSSRLKEAKQLLGVRPVHEGQWDNYGRIFQCITHLIYLLIKQAESEDDKALARELVHNLVKQDPRSKDDNTLLHLCISSTNTIRPNDFTTPDDIHIIFPNAEVITLLLECGANVNARNALWLTPLHLASYPCNFDNSVVKLLLSYGAHLDLPNKFGITAVQSISSNKRCNLNLVKYISLQCWAAQVIVKYGIPINYEDIPVTLQIFLRLHKE